MKVKLVTAPDGKPAARFWCQGCGDYHLVIDTAWNKDEDNPSIDRFCGVHTEDCYCLGFIKDGVVTWDALSTHRFAGKSLPMSHEEAWKKGHDWDKPHGKA